MLVGVIKVVDLAPQPCLDTFMVAAVDHDKYDDPPRSTPIILEF